MCLVASFNLNAQYRDSIPRKLGQKLRGPALHAIIIHCGTKSSRITPPNTLRDSYTQFLLKAQPLSHFNYIDSDTQIRTIFYHITEVNPNLLHWCVVYATLLLCWSTASFVKFLSYTQHFYIAELHPILTPCWSKPYLSTLLCNSQFQHIAELYSILTHCWGIANNNTLLSYILS